jgi:hypothetical protein
VGGGSRGWSELSGLGILAKMVFEVAGTSEKVENSWVPNKSLFGSFGNSGESKKLGSERACVFRSASVDGIASPWPIGASRYDSRSNSSPDDREFVNEIGTAAARSTKDPKRIFDKGNEESMIGFNLFWVDNTKHVEELERGVHERPSSQSGPMKLNTA